MSEWAIAGITALLIAMVIYRFYGELLTLMLNIWA